MSFESENDIRQSIKSLQSLQEQNQWLGLPNSDFTGTSLNRAVSIKEKIEIKSPRARSGHLCTTPFLQDSLLRRSVFQSDAVQRYPDFALRPTKNPIQGVSELSVLFVFPANFRKRQVYFFRLFFDMSVLYCDTVMHTLGIPNIRFFSTSGLIRPHASLNCLPGHRRW